MQVFIVYKDLKDNCILGKFASSRSEFISEIPDVELLTEISAEMTSKLIALSTKWSIGFEELIKTFYIVDSNLRNQVDSLGIEYNGEIPESKINPLGLTPRHIDVTFGGKYMVYCGR